MYYLQAEQRGGDNKGAIVSPETKLLKQKAVQLYNRLLREFPDFHDGDKVTFYLAHEQRELGQFDEMLKTLGELIAQVPQEPAAARGGADPRRLLLRQGGPGRGREALPGHPQAPASPVHDLARYKMGWIRVNQSKHADAVTFFEAAAASAPMPGVDSQKALNVKREALLDLVYSYTEARPAKGALNYFEKLSDSRDHLRAGAGQARQPLLHQAAVRVRHPRAAQADGDPARPGAGPRARREALRLAQGRQGQGAAPAGGHPVPGARGGAGEDGPGQGGDDPQEAARRAGGDGARPGHPAARRGAEEGRPEGCTSRRRAPTTSTSRSSAPRSTSGTSCRTARTRSSPRTTIPRRRASSRSWRPTRLRAKNAAGAETAAYGALLAHFSALKAGEVDKLNAFEVADARQALKLSGRSSSPSTPQPATRSR